MKKKPKIKFTLQPCADSFPPSNRLTDQRHTHTHICNSIELRNYFDSFHFVYTIVWLCGYYYIYESIFRIIYSSNFGLQMKCSVVRVERQQNRFGILHLDSSCHERSPFDRSCNLNESNRLWFRRVLTSKKNKMQNERIEKTKNRGRAQMVADECKTLNEPFQLCIDICVPAICPIRHLTALNKKWRQ